MDPNAFTGARLDRAADGRRRDEAWLAAQSADPRARVLLAGTGGVPVRDGRLHYVPLAEAGDQSAVLLGLDGDGPLFALDADPPTPVGERPRLIGWTGRRGNTQDAADGLVGLREAVAALPQDEGGVVAYAAGMLNWHRANRFCANCGVATDLAEGGHIRRCGRCGIEHHPRIDPVVIMLIVDGDRVLLGRQHGWPPKRYSALAGFVGPGESLEEAIAREVLEEAGVEIGEPLYISSQPWPFPASLMLGFLVPWISGEPGGTDPELEDVRWFTREQITAAATIEESWDGDPDEDLAVLLPPRLAIARRLVERWLEQRG